MKKIPTLFVRTFDGHHNKSISKEITVGMEWVIHGEGTGTIKVDGSCCAIIGGKFYKRYDAKRGKTPPEGAISCGEPDPITGHWPHWLAVDSAAPGDHWHWEAYTNSAPQTLCDGTYEAIGPHFQNNPYKLEKDILVKHGSHVVDVPRSYNGLKEYLQATPIEGIVFWKDGEPRCKIKRSDFGFQWPVDTAEY